GTGGVELHLSDLIPVDFTLRASSHQFLVSDGGSLRAQLDGDFTVKGGVRETGLYAQMRIERGQVELPALATGRHTLQPLGPLADVKFVDADALADARRAAEGTPRRVRGLTPEMEATIDVPHEFKIRGHDLSTTVSGRLTVHFARDGETTTNGELDAHGGFVEVFGQRFDIDRA